MPLKKKIDPLMINTPGLFCGSAYNSAARIPVTLVQTHIDPTESPEKRLVFSRGDIVGTTYCDNSPRWYYVLRTTACRVITRRLWTTPGAVSGEGKCAHDAVIFTKRGATLKNAGTHAVKWCGNYDDWATRLSAVAPQRTRTYVLGDLNCRTELRM